MSRNKYKMDYLDENRNFGCQLFSYKQNIKNDLQTLGFLPNTPEQGIDQSFEYLSEDTENNPSSAETDLNDNSDDAAPTDTSVNACFNEENGNTIINGTVVPIQTVMRDENIQSGQSVVESNQSVNQSQVLPHRQSLESVTSLNQSQTPVPRQSSEPCLTLLPAGDSKPDIVQCTRSENVHSDSFQSHRHSCNIATERRKGRNKSDTQSKKRHHSSGDDPKFTKSENKSTKSDGVVWDGRECTTQNDVPRKQTGIWMTNVDPTPFDDERIWITDVAGQENPIVNGYRDGWRLSLDYFTPKRQGSKRKAKNVSKRIRSYYKSQDDLIKTFEGIRFDTEEDKIDMNKLRKKVSTYAKITFFANLVLLVIKIIAVVLSGSVSLISSLVDSSVDLISGVVIWVTNRLVKRTDPYRYPQGRRKLEPIAVVILSVIMAVASLHLVEETIEKIISLASGHSEPPDMDWVTVGISSTTVVVKLVLFLVCRKVPHHTIQALAQDHRNDVISNTAAIIFGYIGSKEMQAQINNSAPELVFLDPVGAILICIYIAVSWCYTGWGQIKMLTGHTAKPDFLSKITWLSLDHHEQIRKISSVRAFHFGNNFLVEVEISLPANMTVQEACDIAEPLEQKLERLNEVERAFVHIDYETVEQTRNKVL